MRHCQVTLSYLEPGISSLLTGLAMLARRGELTLDAVLQPVPPPVDHGPWHLRNKAESGMTLQLDGGRRAYFDVHDSWEIDADAYASHDVYFKRSFDLARFGAGTHPKLRRLGLVNDVRLDGFDRWELARIVGQRCGAGPRLREALRFLVHSAASIADLGPRPNVSLLQAPPEPRLEPRVLFMAGLWDPASVPPDAPGKAAEFEAINEMRAGCVRQLRAAFGARFFGGVMHTEFARREYPDVLLPEARAASKRAYIKRVRAFPVCIATTGLHGSNGWKLAEYVGLSRAIVSEPLHYAVPGEFAADRNYLEFRTPAECVARVGELLDGEALRSAVMQANWDYYNRWMRPDAFARYVLDTIDGVPT